MITGFVPARSVPTPCTSSRRPCAPNESPLRDTAPHATTREISTPNSSSPRIRRAALSFRLKRIPCPLRYLVVTGSSGPYDLAGRRTRMNRLGWSTLVALLFAVASANAEVERVVAQAVANAQGRGELGFG